MAGQIGKQFHGVTASASLVNSLLLAAEELGASNAELLTNADREPRLPLATVVELDKALRTNGFTSSTAALGEKMGSQDVSMLTYILRNSRTLREYFERISDLWPVVMEIPSPELEVQGDRAVFGCVLPDEIVSMLPHTIESLIVEWVARARSVCDVNWQVREIMTQTQPLKEDEWEQFFGTGPHCGASGTWLVFDAEVLDYEIPGSDPCLLDLLLPVVEKERNSLGKKQSFVQRVESTLKEMLDDGTVNADKVARAMAISTRTLQRRLEQEGKKFGEVLDSIRCSAALAHLRNSRIAISEAAYRVGFSEPSTFYRAFKRWTGETPANYRRAFVG